jgi:hypothetical protein
VGQAATLARELRVGTRLEVRGPGEVAAAPDGSAPVTYTVGPAAGATYAAPALVWPRSVAKTYPGVRCLRDTTATLGPGPVSGTPQPAGLLYSLAFASPGTVTLTFQYRLYGLDLPAVTHPVTVAATAPAAGKPQAAAARPAALEGYSVTGARHDFPGGPREVLRRVVDLGGGTHALETEIACDVLTGPAEALPADLDPAADDAARSAMLEALRAAGSSLAQAAAPGALEVAWAGRRGQDAAGKACYVLARGARWLCRRGDLGGAPIWERLAGGAAEGWSPTEGAGRPLATDVLAVAQATAEGLQGSPAVAAGPAGATTPGAWLTAAQGWLAEDERLTTALQDTTEQVRQGKLTGDEAARKVGQELASGWAGLEAAAAGLVAPAELTRQAEAVHTHLSIAAGLARLAEEALWRADGEALRRVGLLVEGQAEGRSWLRERLARAAEAPPR